MLEKVKKGIIEIEAAVRKDGMNDNAEEKIANFWNNNCVALEQAPESCSYFHTKLGEIYANHGLTERAVVSYHLAELASPNSDRSMDNYTMMGQLHRKLKNYNASDTYYAKAYFGNGKYDWNEHNFFQRLEIISNVVKNQLDLKNYKSFTPFRNSWLPRNSVLADAFSQYGRIIEDYREHKGLPSAIKTEADKKYLWSACFDFFSDTAIANQKSKNHTKIVNLNHKIARLINSHSDNNELTEFMKALQKKNNTLAKTLDNFTEKEI